MSGRKLLLDSNIVIYIAQKKLDPAVFIRVEDTLSISDITFMETLGFAFSNSAEKKETENLLAILIRLSISEEVVQKTVELRQSHRIKLPDAIIAATALVHEQSLVTRNVTDFSAIKGLKVLDPFA